MPGRTDCGDRGARGDDGATTTCRLVGCGRISGAWFRCAREIADLEIIGLVDVREETAHARAEEFELRGAVIGADLETVLDQTTPDIVFDCTSPAVHIPVRLIALRYGCHVSVKSRSPTRWTVRGT